MMVFLVGSMIYAAYVSQGYQKAVVATAKKSIPFSSNYLKLVDYSEMPVMETVNPVLVTKDDDTSTFDVTVNNFSLTNASQSASEYITYTITFRFEGTNTNCKVNDVSPQNGKITFTDTLKLGRNTNTYSFKIPNEEIGNLTIHTTVTPDAASRNVVGNKMLAASLVPQKSAGKIAFQCTGEYVDAENSYSPKDYSAFRYRVAITTGIADVTLYWNPEYVELDPVFKESLHVEKEDEANGYKLITFVMDYSDMSTYNMVFYRKKGRNASEEWQSSWENMKKAGVVKVEATERETDSN